MEYMNMTKTLLGQLLPHLIQPHLGIPATLLNGLLVKVQPLYIILVEIQLQHILHTGIQVEVLLLPTIPPELHPQHGKPVEVLAIPLQPHIILVSQLLRYTELVIVQPQATIQPG